VYSYDALGSFLAIPLGEVSAGPVARAIGTGPALLGAAGIVAVAVAGTLLSRQVRTLEHGPATGPDPVPDDPEHAGVSPLSEARSREDAGSAAP
jgi:hypothetical protein